MDQPTPLTDWMLLAGLLLLAGCVGSAAQSYVNRRHAGTRLDRLDRRIAHLERTAARLADAVGRLADAGGAVPASHRHPPPLSRQQRAALSQPSAITATHRVVESRPLRAVPTPLRHRIAAGDPALTSGPILFVQRNQGGR
jgi:hypothetical protein